VKPIYLDHAATSWPKPPGVAEAMVRFLENVGANPGRSAHSLSVEAARIVYDAREAVAELLGVDDPARVVFGANLTEGLNLALRGLLRPGDHVITSSVEHNAMMRPLRALEAQQVAVTVVPATPAGELDLGLLEAAIRPATVLIAINHASNVSGLLAPVREVAGIARAHGLLLLVDAAQTAGCYPIDVGADCIDLLAFTGHKSLLGPTGTGGLVIGPRVDLERLEPLVRGGTGSRSESEEQPGFLPDRYESGTPNAVGLAGLAAGVRWVLQQGVDTLRRKEQQLARQLLDGLRGIPGVVLPGCGDASRQTATVSFTMPGIPPSAIGLRLDEEFGILCRVGLHCAPAAHRALGTYPDGTVRLAPGPFIEPAGIDRALEAVAAIAKSMA
jgi:cysteine desulfurase family protein